MPVPAASPAVDAHPLAALVDWLTQHRNVLAVAYVALLATVIGLALFSTTAYPEIPHLFLGDADPTMTEDGSTTAIGLGFLLAFELLVILGLGRIKAYPKPGRLGSAATTYVIAFTTLVLAGVCVAALPTALELPSRFDAPSIGHTGITRLLEHWDDDIYLQAAGLALLATWTLWMALAVAHLRRHGRLSTVRRLTSVLLAGSWIEFTLALGVDVGRRTTERECVCQAGSWWTLVTAIPALVFAIGPAIALLYWDEKRRAQSEPLRARRILLAKTRWSRKLRGASP